jgi:hypothetical protein
MVPIYACTYYARRKDLVMSDIPGLDDFGKRFVAFDYAETKDLAKSFLTLATSILAFSVTFSEKIVSHVLLIPRLFLLASWSLLGLAVILCGMAMCLAFIAGHMQVHGEQRVPYFSASSIDLTMRIGYLLVFAGLAFVAGLLALIASGTASLFT